MSTTSNIAGVGPEIGIGPTIEAGPGAQAARAAALQTIREGAPDEVQEVFADLEALGDIVPDTERDEAADEEGDESEELLNTDDGDNDPDDPFIDGWDEDPLAPPDATLPAAISGPDPDEDLEIGGRWRLSVAAGRCLLERPSWNRWHPASKTGRDAIEEFERRLRMMERIASWLTANRGDFLREPDPWRLGCSAWKEFKEGNASVVPEHFLELADIGDLCGESLFSRYRKATVLEWEDATMPLDFLFGPEARMAWVASLVKQAAIEHKNPVDELLTKYRSVTKPKKGTQRRALARRKLDNLDWADLIARANSVAGTKWANVQKAYRRMMLRD